MSMIVNPFIFSAAGGVDCDWGTATGATGFFDATATCLPGLADGGTVGSSTNWLDQISVRSWGQTTAGDRPILHMTGGPNGHPYIEFVDINDNLSFSNTLSQLISGTGYSGFAIVRPQRNGVNDDPWFCPHIIAGGGFFGIALRNAGGGNKFVHWTDRVSPNPRNAYIESTTTFVQNVWYIVEWWFDGTNLGIRVNGDTEATIAHGAPGSLAGNPNVGTGGLISDVAGLYTSNVDIGSVERGTFRNCFGDRFGITLP